jgi:hypothetical protein
MSEKTVLHEEKAPFSFTIKAFLYLVLIFLLWMTIRSFLDPTEIRVVFYGLLVVTLSIALTFWSFLNMRYRLTTEGVEATMQPFTYRVKYAEIDDVYLEKVPLWMGWGIRMWWRRIGFISMHNMAVVVRKKNGVFRNFWLSTLDSEKFAEMINEKMKSS